MSNQTTEVAQSPINSEVLEAVATNPNTDLSEIEMQMDASGEEATRDSNGYINHLLTELGHADQTLDEYEHTNALKNVIFAFWNEGYSGAFAGYGRATLTHWLRTLTTVQVNLNLRKPEEGEKLDWIAKYQELNAEGLKDSDIGGMFATAALTQLKALGGLRFMTFAQVDQFISYLDCALGFDLLTPLTGAEDEWVDQSESAGHTLFQNKRCGAVFKSTNPDTNEEEAYFLDSYVFSDNNGITWFTSNKSRTPITFPYTPETRYVYIEQRTDEDDDSYNYITGWSKEPAIGMQVRHCNGLSYEIINIHEGQVALRDNVRQRVTQISVEQLTTMLNNDGFTYPEYFPLVTDAEREEWQAHMEAQRKQELQDRLEVRYSADDCEDDEELDGGVGTVEGDEPMPRSEAQEERVRQEAAKEAAAQGGDHYGQSTLADPATNKE